MKAQQDHSPKLQTSTTSTSFQGQRLPRSGALCPRIASGLGRTQGGGGSRLVFGLCRPAPAVLVMARKLRPALACAPPRRSQRPTHNARLAKGRTEPDFEPNDRAVVVVVVLAGLDFNVLRQQLSAGPPEC